MSREAILGAIRRGLRRGALPEDEAMALRARLAAHPRHLIPARSRLPRPAQVALFLANLEREFGTDRARAGGGGGAGGGRRLPRRAEPAARLRRWRRTRSCAPCPGASGRC